MKQGSHERIKRYLITSIRWAGSLPLTPGLTVVPTCALCLGAGDITLRSEWTPTSTRAAIRAREDGQVTGDVDGALSRVSALQPFEEVRGAGLLEPSPTGSQLVGDARVLEFQALELMPDGARVFVVIAVARDLGSDSPGV
jgi:hypothetical protein